MGDDWQDGYKNSQCDRALQGGIKPVELLDSIVNERVAQDREIQ